jgi:hypothetical protein
VFGVDTKFEAGVCVLFIPPGTPGVELTHSRCLFLDILHAFSIAQTPNPLRVINTRQSLKFVVLEAMLFQEVVAGIADNRVQFVGSECSSSGIRYQSLNQPITGQEFGLAAKSTNHRSGIS